MTTQLYIDRSGDLAFLLRKHTYFKDSHTHRCKATDLNWTPEMGTEQHITGGAVYQGTIFEHLLIQHLTAFFNVGEHNNILLEGADWNDGMDMGRKRGESVAFTAFYASNLRQLAHLALALDAHGTHELDLLAEVLPLLDTLQTPVDYASPAARRARLEPYFDSISASLVWEAGEGGAEGAGCRPAGEV